MNRGILPIISEIISNGVTWQETIILSLFLVAFVFIVLIVSQAAIAIVKSISLSITESIKVIPQMVPKEKKSKTSQCSDKSS